MAFPSYSPQYQSAAINVGLLEVNGLSGGSVNLGMGSVGGGGGGSGGGGSSNQFIGINGDWATAWINVGLIWSVAGAGAQPGVAPANGAMQRAGQEVSAQVVQPRAPAVQSNPGGAAQPATFRFRWDRQQATARSSERAKEGRYARTPSRPHR